MEQQPPSRSTPPPPPAKPRSSAASGSAAGGAAPKSQPAAPGATPPEAGAPAVNPVLVCPVCKEIRTEDIRFCEECRYDFESAEPVAPPPPEERSGFSGPVLWLVMVFWVALVVGGLIFLYTALWSL